MAQLFELSELQIGDIPEAAERFRLKDNTPSAYKLLRLAMGGVSILNIDTEESTSLENNYLGLFYEVDSEKSYEANLTDILNDSIEIDDLYTFFFDRRYNLKNKQFFNRLENEFCNFLTYQEKGNYTTAFIFLYRILEIVSYSFPLIYAAKTYDFKHTYGKLKSIFQSNSGQSAGELGFLKSAIKVMFEESELLDTSIDIEFTDEFEKNKKVFKAIKSVTKDNLFHSDTIENEKISIKFGEVSSFIITVRNRFFHLFNRGDKNLESIEIIDPDYFFSNMNKPLFSWICVVLIEINKFLMGEYEKYVR